MLNIGRKQKLVVVKKVEFGIYLGETREAGEKERVLLPIKQVPEGTKEGDELEVSEHFWTGVWKKICFFRLNSRPAASIQVTRFWFPSTSTRATVSAQR